MILNNYYLLISFYSNTLYYIIHHLSFSLFKDVTLHSQVNHFCVSANLMELKSLGKGRVLGAHLLDAGGLVSIDTRVQPASARVIKIAHLDHLKRARVDATLTGRWCDHIQTYTLSTDSSHQ